MSRPSRGTRLGDKPNARGLWEITWTENGRSRRLSTGTASRREAEAVLAGYLIEREREVAVKVAAAKVADIVAAYEAEHIVPKAVDVARARACGVPIVGFFGPMLPDEIDAPAVQAYVKQRAPRSGATIRRELQHLRAALLHAVRNRRLSRDAVPHIPMPPKVEPRSYTLSPAEVARFVAACQPAGAPKLSRMSIFAALMLHAPARPRAVLALTWFQVDLGRRLIDYREPGRRQTKKRRVPVPISTALLPILQRAKAEAETEFVCIQPGAIKRAFATAARKAGVPKATPYTLRHTWATERVAAGVPLALVARVLGDTVETVERNYLHLTPDHLRDVVEAPAAGALRGA